MSGKGPSGGGGGGKKGGGAGGGGISENGTLLKDFRVELAKSGAAKCRICEEKIAKVSRTSS